MAAPDQPTPTTTAAQPVPAPSPSAPTTATMTSPTMSSEPPKPEPGAVPVPPTTAVVTAEAPAPTATVVEPTTAPKTETTAAPAPAAPTPAPGSTAPTKTDSDKPKTDSPTEVPERETPLTKKFTAAEWKALKSFREQIPGAFADAFPDKPDARTTPITLWTVKIDPSNLIDPKVNVILVKYLRARNLNVRAARDMFVATLRWREEFNVEAALKEEFPEDVFGSVGHIYGKDKGGRPVLYNIYGGHNNPDTIFSDVQRFLRWRVKLQERSLALLDFETIDQTVQIHDYLNAPGRTPASKNAASEATSIFSSHYPETLYKKFFINVPSYYAWIFWAFKAIIPTATFAKMSVVGTGSSVPHALLPIIDAKELPKRYGGAAQGF